MFLKLPRFTVTLPTVWLCIALLNACGTIATAYPYTVYRGTFIHLPRLNSSTTKPELVRNQGVLWVSSTDGRIKGYDWQLGDDARFQSFLSSHGWIDANASPNDDASSSAQVQVVESNDDRETDPKDTPPEGLRVYDEVVARTLAHGTTCASYFATIHVPATNALAALCHSHGQSAFIGRPTPPYPNAHRGDNPLVHQLFPEASSYADVYDKANLLTNRTILAPGVHLTKNERTLIRERGSKGGHCPASNSAVGSGLAPVRILLDEGLTVGLGTDVSGGYSPSILESARQACLVSRLLQYSAEYQAMTGNAVLDGSEKLSVEDSLYLATRGGAAVVDMADDIGGFDMGMIWDAQLVELGAVKNISVSPLDVSHANVLASRSVVESGPVGNVDLFGNETWQEQIQKWMWSGDDRNVKNV
ncbi:guanine deaminase [Penicillium sp. IBT 16267x]|nr:guanine deaminase [Penicillium sp. IBT 16267x]